LTPDCAGFFEPRWSGLRQLKSTFNAKNFTCRLIWSISSHFVAIRGWSARCSQKLKKIIKTPLLGVQSRSRSSMLTILKCTSSVFVMGCNKPVPICNHFHTVKANNGKITSFGKIPHFDAVVRGKPHHPGVRNFVAKKSP